VVGSVDSLGKRLKRIRKLNNMTQIEFARLIVVSQGTQSDIEKDRCKPSVDTLVSIRKSFKVDINWLLVGE